METVREKTGIAPEEQPKISPEMRERFDLLLRDATEHYYYFHEQINWANFQKWWKWAPLGFKRGGLKVRKLWLEMKRGGELFCDFLAGEIRNELSPQKGSHVYVHLEIYSTLGSVNSYEFFAETLGYKTVWADNDSSTAGRLLGYLRSSKSQESAAAVIRFIDHALSPEYGRKKFLDWDLSNAASSLVSILGTSGAFNILQELAEKDLTLKNWFEKKKLAIKAGDLDYHHDEELEIEAFDLKTENTRLAGLQKELEELEQNPPPEPKPKKLSSNWPESPFRDLEGEDGGEEAVEAPAKPTKPVEPIWPVFPERFSLEESAKGWEREKLLNFYGRFRPKRVRNPEEITSQNCLAGIMAAVRRTEEIPDPEGCLDILSGVISREENSKEIGEIKTVNSAYKMVAVAFARGLSLGVLEGRVDDAISEINRTRDFIGSSAEKFENPAHITFLLSLVDQLGQLQVYLVGLGKLTHSRPLSKSADAFLIVHPSLKRAREVAGFHQLLAEKVRWYLANDLAYNLADTELREEIRPGSERVIVPVKGPSFMRLKEIVDEYREGIKLYKDVEESDVPFYFDAAQSLLKEFSSRRNVVFGRDGRYFFTVVKAAEFGQEGSEQKYVIVTSPMIYGEYDEKLRKSVKEPRERVAKYLRQYGVTLDFNFIDTGFSGSVPQFAIECLAGETGVVIDSDTVDRRIKLLSTERKGRAQLSRGPYSESSHRVDVIEGRPKAINKPRTLLIDEKGRIRPEIKPCPVKEQLQAWVVEHVSFRNFAPKLNFDNPPVELKISPATLDKLRRAGLLQEQMPDGKLLMVEEEMQESGSALREGEGGEQIQIRRVGGRRAKFASLIEKFMNDVAKKKQAEILRDALRLHEVSRDIVAPVVVDFASWCLERVKPGQKVLFLARDGLCPWIAARLLVRQGKFPGITEDQLQYVQLSRRLARQESETKIKEYLSQFGVQDDGEELLTVDVGMYGDLHGTLGNFYSRKGVRSLYLISASHDPKIEGYLSDVKRGPGKLSPLWERIIGNPAVHFLEDTFSGFYGPTLALEEGTDGTIRPKLGTPYSREVYLKRLAAVSGIIDRILLGGGGKGADENAATLNAYFSSQQFNEEKERLMVLHE